jgi:predicted GNAT family acetyltransferase
MSWCVTEDITGFLAAAGGFLRSRAAENTVLLTVADTLHTRGSRAFGDADPVFGWWSANGEVSGAFLQTPPHPVLLARSPDAAVTALAEALDGRVLPGINAPGDAAQRFAAEWQRRTGATAEVARRVRLYRLGELVAPAVPGTARTAGAGDLTVLWPWYEEFAREIGEDSSILAEHLDEALDRGGIVLWELDGVPVSTAARTATVGGVARVAPVYTPPGLRQRGYAGAVTAAVSRAALDGGATDVVLFTDLANPTSNALYQRLGYRPVHDRTVLSFAI